MKKPKRDFRYALRKSLLNKLDIKMSKTDRMLDSDPFLRLGKRKLVCFEILCVGFGMNAYF
jgi:hypothetical protein